MDLLVKILIIIHASFGGLALFVGIIVLSAKKGLKVHRASGLIFFYSMMIAAFTALFISCMPKHENPFLFAIGIFSIYFILIGKRAIRYKVPNASSKIDQLISTLMIFVCSLMIFLPILLLTQINIILFVFGSIGVIFSFRNLQLFKDPKKLNEKWLKLHLGNSIGGYITAATAFVVVNQFLPSFYGWFVPGILGGYLIVYWNKKLNRSAK